MRQRNEYAIVERSGDALNGLETAVRLCGMGQNGGRCDSKQCDVRNRAQILSSSKAARPKTLLTGRLKTGVVSLAFCAQRIRRFESEAVPINGETIIVRYVQIFGAAAVFLSIVVSRMIAGTGGIVFGLAERTAKLLTIATAGTILSVLVHGETAVTNGIADGEPGSFLIGSAATVKRDHAIAVIAVTDSVVDFSCVIPFVGDECAIAQRQKSVGLCKDVQRNDGVGNIGGRRQLEKRQARYAIHQHMRLVTPEELIVFLGMLVGCGMYAQTAVGVGLGLMLLAKLVGLKGFWIVLRGVGGDRRRIQPDEGCVQNALLIELAHKRLHDVLENGIVNASQETVERPVGRQRTHDVETTVMCNDEIIVQIIHQIGDLRKALAFHDDERAKHGRFREALATGSGCWPLNRRYIQIGKQCVVELRLRRCGKEADILQNFLSLDNGHPFSGWIWLNLFYQLRMTVSIYLG